MKILFVSGWGSSVPLAMKCQEEGHEVKFWIQDKHSKDVGDGFVHKVDDYKGHVDWSDYLICDDTHFGKAIDEIRKNGKPVVGGTEMTDVLEEDRGAGQKLFKAVGLDVLDSKEFTNLEEAISYVQDNPRPYVVKVSGQAQNDKSTTYVGQAEDGSDVIPVLEHIAEKFTKGLKSIELQEKKEGIEVGVGGLFNGNKFVGPCEIDWEHKRLMSWNTQQGMGPQTGEMGTVALWSDQDTPLFKKIIVPMIEPLKRMGFHGFFNVNCIVSEGKIYPLEQTNRFGWPTLPMEIETMKENDLGEFFYKVAKGEDMDFEVTHPLSLCLVIGVPPLPYMNDEIFEKYSKDMPILFKEGVQEGMYPGEAKTEDDQWRVAGCSGCAMVCAAGGYNIKDCQEKAYELADQVIVPNKMVRNDIGRMTSEAMQDLEDLELLKKEMAIR